MAHDEVDTGSSDGRREGGVREKSIKEMLPHLIMARNNHHSHVKNRV